ncbi:MAG TPA: flippase-like domain-containing protein, partial [Armatimonadota bacterium]|nr:flippase-like domain-containing protein [Armatimonadota bacterium]
SAVMFVRVMLLTAGLASFALPTLAVAAVPGMVVSLIAAAWLLVALALQTLYYTAFAAVYQRAFRTAGVRLGLSEMAPVVLASVFANLAAPHTGPMVFVEHATRKGHPLGRAVAGVVLAAAVDIATFALILAAGLAYLFSVHSLQPYEVAGAVGMGVTILAWSTALVLGVTRPELLGRLLARLQRTANAVARRVRLPLAIADDWAARTAHEYGDAATVIAQDRPGIVVTAAIAWVAHVIDLASLYAVAVAYGVALSPGGLVAAFSIGVLFWVVSVTPQGVGLAEGSMALVLVSMGADADAAVAVALVFRGLSFWLPMGLGYAAVRRMPWARGPARAAAEPAGLQAIATLTAAMGVLNVVSAVTPSLRGRLLQLSEVMPLQVAYAGHLAAGLAGFALLAVSGGLRRRKRAAWVIATTVLCASVASHLVKGLDYEEAALSTGLIVWLVAARRHFHAASDPRTVRQALAIVAAAVAFTVFYGATGFYLHDRHYAVDYGLRDAIVQTLVMFSSFRDPGIEPVTHFGRYFADSIYTVAAVTLGYGLLACLRPAVLRRPATPEERERARRIVEAEGRSSLAPFALLPDKAYRFSPGGSVTAYTVKGRVAVALGDPIGPPRDARAAIADFVAQCSLHDWVPAYYQTLPTYLDLYAAAGLRALCIGHEAIVRLSSFTLDGKPGRALRTPVNRLTRLGYETRLHEPPLDDDLLAELRRVSDDWLALKHGREKGFSLGWFDEDYIGACPVLAVHAPDGHIRAFANIISEYQLNEVTIDLMRHDAAAERGTMDLLFVRLMEWAKGRGYDGFNLGLAPLAGIGDEPQDPLVEKALRFVYEHVTRFYNFRGLYDYKDKFHPEWSPRYLIYPATEHLLAIGTAIVRASSGTSSLWAYLRR